MTAAAKALRNAQRGPAFPQLSLVPDPFRAGGRLAGRDISGSGVADRTVSDLIGATLESRPRPLPDKMPSLVHLGKIRNTDGDTGRLDTRK